MAPYSMDLRQRVLRAWDSGMDAERVAAKYEVSRAWVHRLVQRRRETGSIAPRHQTKFRRRALAPGQEPRLVALITLWRAIDRLGLTVKKNRTRRRTTSA